MTSQVAGLLFVATVCLGYASVFSEVPMDCCLLTTETRFPRHFKMVSYLLQTTEKGCNIDATVFITKTGLRLCTPHPTKSTWVADYIKRLERNISLWIADTPQQ
ncbi:C-C motif chemokine 4-like [Salvelinus namaycush]|uniref:C-C motif chemokine 4-like n=1 Tax=Salvelinus namaycush TaxID=8040 RepID=A0A8U1F3L8_SALNM|nr:C-C motif chemokine 4-like [Salvelinus namaycush]